MVNSIFVNGEPDRITTDYFRRKYGQKFPDLLTPNNNDFIESAISDVYSMFHGVNGLWSYQSNDVWYEKAQLCYGLLTAWYITDLNPELSSGVVTTGGIPVRSKSIGGVEIRFGEMDEDNTRRIKGFVDTLSPLKSNPFGYKAYTMIRNAVKMTGIFGRKNQYEPTIL